MPDEIEAKIKVNDFRCLREKLEELGAHRQGLDVETNIYFDTPDSVLRSADKGLRIRVARADTGTEKCTITLKGAHVKGALKTRPETEFTIDDPKTAQELLENLGYQVALTFEKRRESWKLKDCKIELDELPYLGKFVEVEGPSEKSVLKMLEAIDLANDPRINTGYAAMMGKYFQEKHFTTKFAKFES